MKLFRARARRISGHTTFDPLDSSGSISGPNGWRFNDLTTEILYTAEVEALATLEVAVRPQFETVQEIVIATINVPDDAVVSLSDLGIALPSNWNARPVANESRLIARQFLDAIKSYPVGSPRPVGLRVPSVLSATNFNVLLDPSRKTEYVGTISNKLPFKFLVGTAS